MPLKSDANRWGAGARALHWLMALLIITLGLVGLYMADLPNSPQKVKIYALHKSFGLTVLALLLLRVAWRMVDRRPDEVPMPHWQALAARGVHGLLYLLMLVLPLSGWLYNSASGPLFKVKWFGLFTVPSLTDGADPQLKAMAHAVHEYGFYLLVLLLLAHVGGALKHHFVDRDATLTRMLPLLRRRDAKAPSRDAAPIAAAATPPGTSAAPAPAPVSAPENPTP